MTENGRISARSIAAASAGALIIVLLIGLVFWIRQVQKQQAVIAALNEIQIEELIYSVAAEPIGVASRGFSKVREPVRFETHGPKWLRSKLGEERCRNWIDMPIEVDLTRSEVADADLSQLAQLPNLKRLDLWATKISDAGVASLRSLGSLEELRLESFHVTDFGMDFVATLPNLQVLTLESASITDAGVQKLPKLSKLKKLHLTLPHMTDRGLAGLLILSQIEELTLSRAQITSLGAVSSWPASLRRLNLLSMAGVLETEVEQLRNGRPNLTIVYEPFGPPP